MGLTERWHKPSATEERVPVAVSCAGLHATPFAGAGMPSELNGEKIIKERGGFGSHSRALGVSRCSCCHLPLDVGLCGPAVMLLLVLALLPHRWGQLALSLLLRAAHPADLLPLILVQSSCSVRTGLSLFSPQQRLAGLTLPYYCALSPAGRTKPARYCCARCLDLLLQCLSSLSLLPAGPAQELLFFPRAPVVVPTLPCL